MLYEIVLVFGIYRNWVFFFCIFVVLVGRNRGMVQWDCARYPALWGSLVLDGWMLMCCNEFNFNDLIWDQELDSLSPSLQSP